MMAQRSSQAMSADAVGKVYLVGAGPGDPGLITVRGLEYLRRADVVVYDRLVGPELLVYAAPDAELIDVGKEADHHPIPQAAINVLLLERAQAGKTVVRLKGGDPFVFGRGGEEALALSAAGVPFEIVPGVSSAIAAPAYAGIPVTQRGVAGSVTIVTGHRCDGVGSAECEWERLAATSGTLVFLMGVGNLPNIVAALLRGGRPAATPVAVVARGTCPGRQTVTGTLADIVACAEAIRPPALIVVGEVVRLRDSLHWFPDSEL
jgi:uroporphyrin-III C-methyltransferase